VNTKTTHSIFTDVASIIVADPCRVMSREDWRKNIEERWHAHENGTLGHGQPFVMPDYGIIVPTVQNCDGWCNVRVERGKDGWPRRLIVNLSAGMRRDGDAP
jgi:hypothetical protein